MPALLKPEEWECPTPSGPKTFILSKFPAVAGREILAKYPLSAIPKVGDYAVNEETMLKLMSYVAIQGPNGPINLSTRALVDNHCEDAEVLLRVEIEMLKRNCSFFRDGRASNFLQGIARKAQTSLSEMSTLLSAQLSKAAKQASKN